MPKHSDPLMRLYVDFGRAVTDGLPPMGRRGGLLAQLRRELEEAEAQYRYTVTVETAEALRDCLPGWIIEPSRDTITLVDPRGGQCYATLKSVTSGEWEIWYGDNTWVRGCQPGAATAGKVAGWAKCLTKRQREQAAPAGKP